ncbi:Na/Pi symporter [Planctobacterium marinum]|uniref:Na/Pi symporter n=1 Tax=Planctobacterium marinum TaxID=1631968 RepID=UPI001E3A00C4|nr:Na/Pi symporter [Planctobacterium marinum]MCC2606876.1 Na/Pi symporter [Planctobacterium marinum]
MHSTAHEPHKNTQALLGKSSKNAKNWALLLLLVYGILVAVTVIGTGFKLATGDHARELFEFASNPVLGLIIGMVCTALIQSSSTVSSIIVAMVAGGLPITIAIPMIMGANIGTSITSTLVSLGHIADKKEFQRAFASATIHDFFNLLSVVIFLPLEIAFNLLERLSGLLMDLLYVGGGFSLGGFNPLKAITKPVAEALKNTLAFLPDLWAGAIMAILGVGLIILSITFMGKTMKALMVGKAKDILHSSIGKGPVSGIASGTFITVLVQSSSTTTSLIVPLVGTNVLTHRDIYPFVLGANIGTCITALIAALAVTGANAGFALQIALVHLLYNVLGVLLIYGVKYLRELPILFSHQLSLKVADRKAWGLAYILGLFFVLPLSAILLTN